MQRETTTRLPNVSRSFHLPADTCQVGPIKEKNKLVQNIIQDTPEQQ